MVCRRCGNNFNTQECRQRDGSTKCPSCGAVYRSRPPQQQSVVVEDKRSMACPRCGSHNTSIQFVQTGATTKSKFNTRYKGRGCLYWIYFICFGWMIELIKWCCFFWVPLLVKSVSKGNSKTKFSNQKMAVCNNCGHSWKVR